MNRRNFLKSLAAFVGAAAVPQAVVQARQIEAPVPKDWIVGLLDAEGNVFAQMEANWFGRVVFPAFTRAGTVTHGFVEGKEIGRRVMLLTATKSVCTGDSIVLTTKLHDFEE